MSIEHKIDNIEKKIIQLIEQNAHYRRTCNDLLEKNKQLEAENEELMKIAQSQDNYITKLKAQQPTGSTTTHTAKDSVATREEIDEYIQLIDETIEWLSQE